jgi:hypothetical protein
MQIQIEPPHATAPTEWRSLAEHRVRFVMRRLRSEVMQVQVRLDDVNGPRGGIDQRCQLSLTTEAHGILVVSATKGNAISALNMALRRAAAVLVRLWQRQHRLVRATARLAHSDVSNTALQS